MHEEKARKALPERDRIISKRKETTPVKFKRNSKTLANQLISAQQAMDSDEKYEMVSESIDSPPKVNTAASNFFQLDVGGNSEPNKQP